MSLDLRPETESRVREYAAAEGVSVDDLISRAFPPRTPAPADNPMLQLLQARLREAENATAAEVARADAEYRRWQEGMNESRRANGERPLFPGIAPETAGP